MTVRTLISPFTTITIIPGMIVKLEAVSPTTGAAITGVSASAWAVYGHQSGVQVADETDETFSPAWVWGGEEEVL